MKSLFLLCVVAIAMACGLCACGPSMQQVAIAPELLPSEFASTNTEAEHVIRVRVYAGADYRARVADWRKELAVLFEQSSSILSRECGIKFEIDVAPVWKRSGGKLAHVLKTLTAQDPGLDVDLVIGLIDAPNGAELEMDKLVQSIPLGRHLVLRSFNQQAESTAIGLVDSDLSEAQQEGLLEKRRRHKQTVVLVHGIAALLGADLGAEAVTEKAIDGKRYHLKQTELRPAAAAVMKVTIKAFLAPKHTPSAWKAAIAEFQELGILVPEQFLSLMRARSTAGTIPKRVTTQNSMREVDRDSFLAAKRLSHSGSNEEAWVAMEPLVELYPQEADIADLACLISQKRQAADALSHCQLATQLHQEHAANWISLAELRVETSPDVAFMNLKRARLLLKRNDTELWLRIARAFRELSMPGHAESAVLDLQDMPAKTSVLEWVNDMRIRYGVDIIVVKAGAGKYLKALKEGLRQVYKREFLAAEKIATQMATEYPQSIASPLLRCEIALRRRKYAPALSACQRVLDQQKNNSWATYLIGVIQVRRKQIAPGIANLQTAIRLDSRLKAAYLALASVYSKSKDARLEPLGTQYQAQFGEVLP